MTLNLCDTIIRLAAILIKKENEGLSTEEAVAGSQSDEPTSEPTEEEMAAKEALEASSLEEMAWTLDSLAVFTAVNTASCKF